MGGSTPNQPRLVLAYLMYYDISIYPGLQCDTISIIHIVHPRYKTWNRRRIVCAKMIKFHSYFQNLYFESDCQYWTPQAVCFLISLICIRLADCAWAAHLSSKRCGEMWWPVTQCGLDLIETGLELELWFLFAPLIFFRLGIWWNLYTIQNTN